MSAAEHEHRKVGGGGGPEASAASTHQPGKSTRVEGGHDNVDLTHLNTHRGFDANRLGHNGGKNYKTIHTSPTYGNDGTATKHVIPAGSQVEINAGALSSLVLAGGSKKPVTCVYVFMYEKPHAPHPKKDYEPVGAWMPASAVPGAVEKEQAALAERIAKERGDKHEHFGHGVEMIKGASPEKDGIGELFTYPRQGITNKDANKAKYYYYNLALNLPYTGGERVGVLTDNIPGGAKDEEHGAPAGHALDPYREFFPEDPVNEKSIPLFKKGKSKPVGKHLTFVYGYVKNDTGQKIHGWINKACLPGGFAHKKK
jgi:hypothetical protein